jgi:TatD DNase family protein
MDNSNNTSEKKNKPKKKRTIEYLEAPLPIIETHCHLDYLKEFPLQEIIKKSFDLGIEKIITIAVSPDNLDTVLNIALENENIFCTQGIHPHSADEFNDEVLAKIKKSLTENEVAKAVGEIGLDYHYTRSPIEDQKNAFEKQLQLAVDLDLPVVIHTRDADDDTRAILKNFTKSLKGNGVIHSYTSSIELAEFCLREGFYIGFNGIITFNNAQNVRDVLKITPIEKILFETDSPFLTPMPNRGIENGPYFLPLVAKKIAEVKEIELTKLLPLIYQNSMDLFKL